MRERGEMKKIQETPPTPAMEEGKKGGEKTTGKKLYDKGGHFSLEGYSGAL